MGMTWSEYKAYREKKKKEEQQKAKTEKKQEYSKKTTTNTSTQNNTSITKEISSPVLNASKNNLISNTNTWQDTINKTNTPKFINTNNNPLAKIVEEKTTNNPLQKAIEEQKRKPKTTNTEPSTWDRIMDNARLGGYSGVVGVAQTGYRDFRDIDNLYLEGTSMMRNTVLSTLFGETGQNWARAIDETMYKANEDRNKFYDYALGRLNQEQQKNTQDIQQNIGEVKKSGDKVGTKFTELSSSIGQNAVGMVATAVNPALGFTYYKMSSEASYYDDALNRGMTENQAKAYSKIMSYVEAGTETLSASNIVKGGRVLKAVATGTKSAGAKAGLKAGFNILKQGAKEEVASSFKNALKSYGIGIAEEAFQEGITEPLQELTAMATAGKDKADWSNMSQRIFNSAFDGALSSLVLAGSNMGISSCQGVVTKLNNNQQVNTEEFNQAVKDASKELDAGKMLTDSVKQEVDKVKNELQAQESQQNKDNNIVDQETKTPQNATLQTQNDAKTQTTSNLEKVKQFYDEDTYNQMKNFIETAPNEQALNQINEDIKTETKNRLEETYKSEKFTESKDRKQTYAQYQRQNNTTGIQYDNSVVDNALDTVPANRNDKRTVEQWKQVAEQIGLNSTDLTKSEIDDIAYGSWFDLQPTKNITRYDNRTKTNKSFEKFTSNDWINTIYESAKEQKLQKLDTELNQAIDTTQEQNLVTPKDNSEVMNEVQDYINKNNLDMTTNEFVEWASNVELENEENMTQEQKELYSLISDIQNKTNSMYNEKNVDKKTPTDNPDIRYSKQNQSWQDYLEKNYKSEGTTTDLRDIRLKQEVKAPIKQEQTSAKNAQVQNNNTKGETINWNEIERPENNQKFRKHYRSIIESNQTTAEAKAIAKELMGTDTYEPETNKGQLAQADQRIMTSSPETELQSLLSRAMNGEKISSVDIAVGERLIQYFSKTGSKQQLQEAIQATAMAGTSAGQTVQALAMLNHQTPQGQATWIQRSVDKMNTELAKKKGGTITTDENGNLKVINKQGIDITDKVDLFNLTPEMIDKIMNSENQEQMYKNIDEVYEELGQQVPKSMLEKVDSWRYFSMLANARTHIRNMVGNVAMGKMQRIKDKIAGGIEGVVSQFNPNMERTKTLAFADKKTKDFAKQDFKNMEVQSRLELNENKYNPQSRLQNARRTFKSNAMENTLGRLFNLNDKLLSAEDGIGLKAGYQKALADYLTANKIDVDNITDSQLNKARNYAIQQAKEATFHQANAIASLISTLENKNLGTKLVIGGLLPFKKTPMNVAKAGIEYSPLQVAKSFTIDYHNLRTGKISINQYIDNLSKGLTGSGVALIGYALANAGLLKASGDEDKDKEKYDEEQGKQSYSIQIAGKTYSLDWLAPTGIPLFVGAEAYKLLNQESKEKSTEKSSEEDKLKQALNGAMNIANAGATAINPMSEMSMISGLTSALSSYNSDGGLGKLGSMATNIGKSYINQFVPTLFGQVAKTTDQYERTTKSTAKGTLGKAVDQTINQIKNKIPGLRQTLPIKTDIWGKELKQEVNLPLRAVNNFINPATVKEVSTDKVDKELNKLYEVNKNSSLLPDILTKTVQLNKQTYRLSNKEYAQFTKNYGQTSHKLIEDFIKTSDYSKLTQEQKETAISDIYSYAKEQNKLDYAKKVNEKVKPSTLYTTMKEIEEKGGRQSEYLNYLAKTKGMNKESEKNKVLADSNYSNRTKEIIYTNGTGKDDNSYNSIKNNCNITNYLKYKSLVTDRTKELRAKGELKESQNLNDRQQIELLTKTNYSPEEKKAIYSGIINNKDTVYTGLSKLTDVNIDAYLNYKMQEIKGNDDPDSNIKGKSENGSRKKNFIKYLNSSNLSGLERLYIYGKNYKYKSNQQAQMKQILNNSNLSNKDKLEVLKGLTANIEEHENGKYYWKKPAK